MKKKIITTFFLLIAIVLVGLALWTWIGLSYVYSDGERAGYVQKFTKKGWLIKTWEGEIAMVTIPGASPEKFLFSVRNDVVAQKIQDLMGKRVVLSYNEQPLIPLSIFGETKYFVVDARDVEDHPDTAPPAAIKSDPKF